MATIVDTDVSIDSSGNIRWTGAKETNRHTVLEFIQFLMDKQDDAQAAGDDLLDITVDTPFNRSTDQILTLNAPFNIDDTFATHLYDGSVTQSDGDDVYSGLGVIGPVETGTEYMILQGGKVLPAFWGTGINPEASPSLVFSRHLVKSREGGADIDGQRITVLARELGDQYRRFPVTLGTGNSVAAISNGADIFNEKTDATLEGYTTIVNTEGYQQIDIDGNGTGAGVNEYYSQWTKAALEVNDVYEKSKWISQRSHTTDSTGGSPTGTNLVVDNATITGQAQQFTSGATIEVLTEARMQVKIGAEDTTGLSGTCYAELYASDAGGPDAPTGAVLARSEDILVSAFTSSYEDTIFRFNRFDPSDGSDQIDGLQLAASTTYFIAIRHDDGSATNYLHVDSGVSQDAAQDGATDTAGWAGSSTQDMNCVVKSSPIIHGLPGEIFQGINVEVGYDGEGGVGVLETEATNDELAVWGTRITHGAPTGTFRRGEYVGIYANGTTTSPKSGGEILFTDGTDMIVALENPAASVIANGDDLIAVTSGATADLTTIDAGADETYSGGSGYVLAKDDNTGSGELYIQVVSGVNPVDNNTIYSTTGTFLTDHCDATSAITTRTVNPEFIGTSTGSNLIGAYGIGFDKDDVGASDKFFDLSNTDRTPPNNVTFSVTGLVAGEDRVLVGPRTASALETAQLTTGVTLSAGAETTIDCTAAFPAGTPDSGTLRVELDDPVVNKRIRYEAKSGTNDYTILAADTFADGDVDTSDGASGNSVNIAGHSFVTLDKVQLTSSGTLPAGLSLATDYWIIKLDADNIQFAASVADAVAGTDVDITGAAGGGTHTITPWENVDSSADAMADFTGNNATSGNNVFLTYIDTLARTSTESYTAVHTSNVNLFVRVRDGGGTPIKTFESASAQFLSTAQSVAAVRTADV